LQLASQTKLSQLGGPSVPIDPNAIPVLGPDMGELVFVIITLAVSIGIMVALGRWWAQ
jgi:hypothetical protein